MRCIFVEVVANCIRTVQHLAARRVTGRAGFYADAGELIRPALHWTDDGQGSRRIDGTCGKRDGAEVYIRHHHGAVRIRAGIGPGCLHADEQENRRDQRAGKAVRSAYVPRDKRCAEGKARLPDAVSNGLCL